MKHRGTWVRRGACALTLVGSVALAGAPQAGAVTLGQLAVVARDYRFSGVPHYQLGMIGFLNAKAK